MHVGLGWVLGNQTDSYPKVAGSGGLGLEVTAVTLSRGHQEAQPGCQECSEEA